jgi:chromosome segregation ATPase
MSSTRRAAAAAAWAAFCLIGGTLTQAQTQPAKPAQAPGRAGAAAAAPAASARGFGNARGALLTRDELRACFAQEDALKKKLAAQEAARAPLEQDKKVIAEEQSAMRAERAKLQGGELPAAIAAFTTRSNTFNERRMRWEARLKEFNDAGRSAKTEERDALEAERLELEKERTALEAERTRLQAQQDERAQGTQAFNVRVKALDARVDEWNKRSHAWNDANVALEAERGEWVTNCGNRRYREEDEIAIRSGK